MSIQLAFSTVACPEWSIEQVIAQAKAIGFQGVELRTLGQDDARLPSDPIRCDPANVRKQFGDSGVIPVCLSSSTSLHHSDGKTGRRALEQAQRDLELAAAIGCPFVRFFGCEIRPGESRNQVIHRIGDRLNQLLPLAGEAGLGILMENTGPFSYVQDWWTLMNLLDHPLMGMCWNVAAAAEVGETSAVSVPMLNSRIHLARVKDAKLDSSAGLTPLGQGDVQVQGFVKRLLGIGYDGFITFEWDRLWIPTLAPAEQALPQAQKTLQGWLDEVAQAIEKAKPKPKPAKTEHAAKPRPVTATVPLAAAPSAPALP